MLAAAKPFWVRFTHGIADLILDEIRFKLKERRKRGSNSGEIGQSKSANLMNGRHIPRTDDKGVSATGDHATGEREEDPDQSPLPEHSCDVEGWRPPE